MRITSPCIKALEEVCSRLCGHIPIGPLDLVPRATKHQFSGDAETRVKEIRKLHEDVKVKIEKQNEKYQKAMNKNRKKMEFKVGDLV